MRSNLLERTKPELLLATGNREAEYPRAAHPAVSSGRALQVQPVAVAMQATGKGVDIYAIQAAGNVGWLKLAAHRRPPKCPPNLRANYAYDVGTSSDNQRFRATCE